jgi:hypothetical protein
LSETDAEKRWLTGERIFAGIQSVVRPSSDVELVARKIAERIG